MRAFMTGVLFVLFALFAGRTSAAEVETVAEWDGGAVAACRRSPAVGPAPKGGLTLTDRDLIQYEVGGTVHAPDRRGVSEVVTDRTWIRKDFFLDSPSARGAVLSFCHSTLQQSKPKELIVTFNGTALPYTKVHTRARPYSGVYPKDKFPKGHPMHHMNGKPYESWWEGGWERVDVPVDRLRKGLNTVLLRARPGGRYSFLIEPSLFPNRSAVSRDGGRTWEYDRLSANANLDGEYIIRLLLRRHPATGWIESEAADLWPRERNSPVATPAQIVSVRFGSVSSVPEGAELEPLVRLGPTPTYDPATWTAWCSPDELRKGTAGGRPIRDGAYRFVQWRAKVSASPDHLAAPALGRVRIAATVEPEAVSTEPRILSCRVDQPRIVRSSHVFVHAKNSRRLRLLREQAKLDEVVAGKARGLEQLQAICAWIRSLRLGNKKGSLMLDAGWDGLMFWNAAKPGLTSRMCTHRGAFFVQCATALGYAARPCIWSHAIAEAWVDDPGTWVAFDPSGGHHYEVDGRPASMLAVAKVWPHVDRNKVRRVWSPKRKSNPLNHRNVGWYTRFFVPMRSNWLESPEPAEHGHGSYFFKYDRHLRWLHPEREPFPWFAHTTTREGDLAFTVNTVNVHLARTPETGTLAVTLETDAPNLARFEVRTGPGEGEWAPARRAFTWKLSAGKNTLEARTVNTFGLSGRVSKAEVVVGK